MTLHAVERVVAVVVVMVCLHYHVHCQSPFFPISQQNILNRGQLITAIPSPGSASGSRSHPRASLSLLSDPYGRVRTGFANDFGGFSQQLPHSSFSPIFGRHGGLASQSALSLLDKEDFLNNKDNTRTARTQLPSEGITRRSTYPGLARNHPFSSIRLNPVPTSKGVSMTKPQREDPFDRGRDGRFSSLFDTENARKYSLDAPSTFEKPISKTSLPDVNSPIQMDLASDEQERVAYAKQNGQLPPSRGIGVVLNEERPKLTSVFGKGLGSRRLSQPPNSLGRQAPKQQITPLPTKPRLSPSSSSQSGSEPKQSPSSDRAPERTPPRFDDTAPFDEPDPKEGQPHGLLPSPENNQPVLSTTMRKDDDPKVDSDFRSESEKKSDKIGRNRAPISDEKTNIDDKIDSNLEETTTPTTDAEKERTDLQNGSEEVDKSKDVSRTQRPFPQTTTKPDGVQSSSSAPPESSHKAADIPSTESPFLKKSETKELLRDPLLPQPNLSLNRADSLSDLSHLSGNSDSPPDNSPNLFDSPRLDLKATPAPESKTHAQPRETEDAEEIPDADDKYVNDEEKSMYDDKKDMHEEEKYTNEDYKNTQEQDKDMSEHDKGMHGDDEDMNENEKDLYKEQKDMLENEKDIFENEKDMAADDKDVTAGEKYVYEDVNKTKDGTKPLDYIEILSQPDLELPPPIDAIPPDSIGSAVSNQTTTPSGTLPGIGAVGESVGNALGTVRTLQDVLTNSITTDTPPYQENDVTDDIINDLTAAARKAKSLGSKISEQIPDSSTNRKNDVISMLSTSTAATNDLSTTSFASGDDAITVSTSSEDHGTSLDSSTTTTTTTTVGTTTATKDAKSRSVPAEDTETGDGVNIIHDDILEGLKKVGQGRHDGDVDGHEDGGILSDRSLALPDTDTPSNDGDESSEDLKVIHTSPQLSAASQDETSSQGATSSDHQGLPPPPPHLQTTPPTEKQHSDIPNSSSEEPPDASPQEAQGPLLSFDTNPTSPPAETLSAAAEEFLSLSNKEPTEPASPLTGSEVLTDLSEKDLQHIPKDLKALQAQVDRQDSSSNSQAQDLSEGTAERHPSPFELMFGKSLQETYRQTLGSLFGNLQRGPSQPGSFVGVGLSGAPSFFGQGGGGFQDVPVAAGDPSRGLSNDDYLPGKQLFDSSVNSIVNQRPSLRLFGNKK